MNLCLGSREIKIGTIFVTGNPLLQNVAYKRIGHRLSISLIIDMILIQQNIKIREGLYSRGTIVSAECREETELEQERN